MAVCSGVRWALSLPPIALTSLKSRFHVSLVKLGGGPGRNWSALVSTHVLRFPQCGTAGNMVGTYTPGAVCGRYVLGAIAPSSAHRATTFVATCSPTAMPSVLAWPSATDFSRALYSVSIAACCAGTSLDSAVRVAASTAASTEAPDGAVTGAR